MPAVNESKRLHCPPTFLVLAKEPQKELHIQSGHGSGNKKKIPLFAPEIIGLQLKCLVSKTERKGKYKNKKCSELLCF
jgi:hypothetical protein